MKKGQLFADFLADIDAFINTGKGTPGFEREFSKLEQALAAYREMQAVILGYVKDGKPGMLQLLATRMQKATAQIYGSYCLLEQALIAARRLEELGADHYDYNFYYGKVLSARFFIANVLPDVSSLLEVVKYGDESVLEAPVGIFDY
jgi:hypothetical protein